MKLQDIIKVLNSALKEKYPELKGYLIARESIEPIVTFGAYKNHRVDIYYHIPGNNKVVFTHHLTLRDIEETKETAEKEFLLSLLGHIFVHLNKIENEVTKI